tara:strand:+ start:338 stop:586 length:249 start_codon:yes stop_codon:yes gene_type:complete
MEKTVLSQEELNSLATLQQQQDNFIVQLGQVEYQISTLERTKNIIRKNIESFEKQQIELGDQLKQKYGEGTINLESGEFVKS